ncbi:ABC transporter ATP-binding protein [Salinibacterium sp. dk2585]|uniref:ABC transporter ATP-binding protein n=1 Tax=unclassified Salinibacterium TaxID=2632331 RepID=UPI0011C24505|nr:MULTISPECIES: ABC transporter ATP-binding protein [unclassified Salinibacterium]QEE60364.1 ABC transporter ATP-binding protein [Salinibacterium sp. dk2585]TXK55437.1 ABC transporter ATP-binding protein [Salinibacterium sp. dk5596]
MTDTATAPAVRESSGDDIVLSAKGLVVEYPVPGKKPVRAVHGIDIELRRGETLGLVGESGCGKSSTGRALVMLPPPTEGEVMLGDLRLDGLTQKQLRKHRKELQLIFQDPISSLNPRRTALEIVMEPLTFLKHPKPKERALELLQEVGVDAAMAKRKPHQLSGGQCQRVSIARGVAQQPSVIICDEPVSALDVSVQAQVLNLLERMKDEHDLSLVFISHDLAVVKNISDRVAVMYLGRIVELAGSEEIYQHPRHHYTALLLSSIPQPNRPEKLQDVANEGEIATSPAPSGGCPFAARCPAATEICRTVMPPLAEIAPGHRVACHHPIPVEAEPDLRSAS